MRSITAGAIQSKEAEIMKEFFNKKNVISLIVIPLCVYPVFYLFFFYMALSAMPARLLYGRSNANPMIIRNLSLAVSLAVVLLVSWFVFRAKGKELLKALVLMFVLMVVFSTVMRLFGMWMWLYYLIDGVIFLVVLMYLNLKKKPWVYSYAAVVTVLLLLGFIVFDMAM